ncbi:D-hexose-6-phosphate mutarotase [Arsukibacterium sp.]|uniref:D-hexose-6-phosphate mutarotase n=1 Tax=Arsukibacterium sp. TaxID=1977258 RepID=UPI00299DC991|nr:D-hexose-6-phosphate mutarotase [Arsukibacterium sp.]MDX1676830.1 D-hexose-6-phosphate mutarotase [Arsukibacterium sp.]
MLHNTLISQTGFAKLVDLPCLQLRFGRASAVISLYGGQVLSYQPQPGNEILWLSDKAQWHNNTAIRGGVPVCWPWFGPAVPEINPDNLPLPNHGLVRNRLWQLTDSKLCDDKLSVTLGISVTDLPAALWPDGAVARPVNLSLSLTLNNQALALQLSCDTALYQQAALHSYFRINQLSQTRVTGLSHCYFDKVRNAKQASPSSETSFNGETDRIYYATGKQLQLTDAESSVIIEQYHHDASVIWNPWQQKSRALPDMADQGFTEFVCVETARLNLKPATGLTLGQTLMPL